MHKRLLIAMLLVLIVVSGMAVEVFASPLQKALTLPATPGAGQIKVQRTAMQRPTISVHAKSSATPQQNPTGIQQMQGMFLAHDTFHRGNQALWGTASDGNQWSGDANTNPAFSVVKATGNIAPQTAETLNALLGSATMNANVMATMELNQFGSNVNMGVILRWTDANNWYKAYIDGTHLILLKRVQGQPTTILSTPFMAQSGVAYSIRFQSIGAMLFARVWPANQTEPQTWMIETSDQSLTSGLSGLRVVLQAGSSVNITAFTEQSAQLGGDL